MNTHNTFGIDLAKRIFHIVQLDHNGKKVLSLKLDRNKMHEFITKIPKKSVIAMEACSGCHYWAQQAGKAGLTVKVLKTTDVKAYAKTKQKNDSNDALAIAKAARDPELKAVTPKSPEEQYIMLLHKLRSNSIQNRIKKSNSLMAVLAEFGYIAKCNKSTFGKIAEAEIISAFQQEYISNESKELLLLEAAEIMREYAKEHELDKLIIAKNKTNEKAKLLQTITGIGPINASILSISPIESYESPRDFSASLGLVPSQSTTGGKVSLGRITKKGACYNRTMLIQAGRSVAMQARIQKNPTDKLIIWAKKLHLQGKEFNKVCVAIANKLARISHAVVCNGSAYQADYA